MEQKKSIVENIMGAVPILGSIYGLGQAIFGKSQEENQKLQIEGQKEMTDYNYGKSIQMIHDSTAAQKQAFKNNNLNTALMYQGGGAGGTSQIQQGEMPAGVIAPNAVEKAQFGLQAATTAANLKLTEAQTKNVEADTAKKLQEAPNIETNTASAKFDLELKNRLKNDLYELTHYQAEMKYYDKLKGMAEYNAWSQANFEGKASDDPNSPLAKAMSAGIKQTLIELETAKANNDIAKAEKTIKEFTANLTKQGIAEGTPWYVKMIGDLFQKAGINLNQIEADAINNPNVHPKW